MKAFLLVLLFALPSFAQSSNPSNLSAPGCGPADTKFDATTTKKANSPTKAEPGKALVFFLQDDIDFQSTPQGNDTAGT